MRTTQFKHIVLLLLPIMLLAACGPAPTDEPPGVGEKAERGYAACAPVIAALEQYSETNGGYPDSLADLAPGYLSVIPTEVNDNPISYKKTDESYVLTFGYVGPGMNICAYSPEQGWRCTGAF